MNSFLMEESVLKQDLTTFDDSLLQSILSKKETYINLGNEIDANYCWYLEKTYNVKKDYVKAFYLIRKGEYEEAWKLFDSVDIDIYYICNNFDLETDDAFGLLKIREQIHYIQELFPYRFFISRESVVVQEHCSICGAINSLRKSCKHLPGKIYMGDLCLRQVDKMDLKGFAIVERPFDKYAFLKFEDMEYDYSLLRHLSFNIRGPYDYIRVESHKEKIPAFSKLGRNDTCACGSGKKYKKCCLMTGRDMYDVKKIIFYHPVIEKNLTSIIEVRNSKTFLQNKHCR